VWSAKPAVVDGHPRLVVASVPIAKCAVVRARRFAAGPAKVVRKVPAPLSKSPPKSMLRLMGAYADGTGVADVVKVGVSAGDAVYVNSVACGDCDGDAVRLTETVAQCDEERHCVADGEWVSESDGDAVTDAHTVCVPLCKAETDTVLHGEGEKVDEGRADAVGAERVAAALPECVPVPEAVRVGDAADANIDPAVGEMDAEADVVRESKGAPPAAPDITGVTSAAQSLPG
jgi:hypothetical protein